jgi:hypothetical protein
MGLKLPISLKQTGVKNKMANDYDDSDLKENKKSAAANKKDAEEIMKKGKMAPSPNKPKMKFRCGAKKSCGHRENKQNGGLVTKGKPKIAKKGWK